MGLSSRTALIVQTFPPGLRGVDNPIVSLSVEVRAPLTARICRMIEGEKSPPLNSYGYSDTGLGFAAGLLYLFHLDGSLGS